MAMIQTGVTPNAGVPRVAANKGGQVANLNDALTQLSMLVQFRVIGLAPDSPPGSPDEGDAYLLTDSSVGYSTGGQHDIAYYSNGWRIIVPKDGWHLRDLTRQIDLVFDETRDIWYEEGEFEGSLVRDLAGDNANSTMTKVVNHYTSTTSDAAASLPQARAGRRRIVINDGSNDIEIYAEAGREIDELGDGNPRSVPAGKRCLFIGLDDDNWSSFLSA